MSFRYPEARKGAHPASSANPRSPASSRERKVINAALFRHKAKTERKERAHGVLASTAVRPLALGGLMPTRMKISGLRSGSSMDSLMPLICSDRPPMEE